MTEPYDLGEMPSARLMTTVDELVVGAPVGVIFDLAADVERWPAHLRHYNYVIMTDRRSDGGGIVEMSADRPFGPVGWPTWWMSEMSVDRPDHLRVSAPRVRFRHIRGVTKGMDVEWSFTERGGGAGKAPATLVRIVHVWNGPRWPLIGALAAKRVIGPVFVHGIASRTLAGLARVAEGRG